MASKDKDVQGAALYMEFRKPRQTIQLFVTPEGYAEDGSRVPPAFFRRMLTSTELKKRWKFYQISERPHHINMEEALKNPELDDLVVDKVSAEVKTLYQYMSSLVRGGYLLVKEPIYVEVSKDDMTSIQKRDTPVKVINRIKAVRAALDFPEAIVNH